MTDYIEKINGYTIGGDIADGEWHLVSASGSAPNNIFSSKTFSSGSFTTYSLDKLLPDDDYDYECLFTCLGITGTVSGNQVGGRIYSGTVTSNTSINADLIRINTRTSSSRNSGGSAIIPIYHTDRNVTWSNTSSGSADSGSCYLGLVAYRRIGSNNLDDTTKNYVEKINNNQIGGDNFHSVWVTPNNSNRSLLTFTTTIAASSSLEFDISSAIPYDGYSYMLSIDTDVTTAATSGNSIIIHLSTDGYYNGGRTNSYTRVISCVTRTASTQIASKNCYIPISSTNRIIRIYNSASYSGTVTLRIRAYRRIGNNNALTLTEPLEKINNYNIGGAFLDDTWVYKVDLPFTDTDIESGKYVTVDLSEYLPNDGYDYEVLLNAYGLTGSTSGTTLNLAARTNYGMPTSSLGQYNANSPWFYLCRTNTRSASTTICGGSAIVPITTDRLLFAYNGTSYTDYSCQIQLEGYRRIGTNE